MVWREGYVEVRDINAWLSESIGHTNYGDHIRPLIVDAKVEK